MVNEKNRFVSANVVSFIVRVSCSFLLCLVLATMPSVAVVIIRLVITNQCVLVCVRIGLFGLRGCWSISFLFGCL